MKKTGLMALILAGGLLPAAAWAQASRTGDAPSLGQAERKAVELKQGMTPEEVQKLLGKPRRTALRADGGSAQSGQGMLQWTYVWGGASASTSSERMLHVDFIAKSAGQWTVNGWAWPAY
jgi:hypothetical protein